LFFEIGVEAKPAIALSSMLRYEAVIMVNVAKTAYVKSCWEKIPKVWL
jgi:hypothetical protein